MYIKVSFFIKKNIYMYLLKCFPFNFKYSENEILNMEKIAKKSYFYLKN